MSGCLQRSPIGRRAIRAVSALPKPPCVICGAKRQGRKGEASGGGQAEATVAQVQVQRSGAPDETRPRPRRAGVERGSGLLVALLPLLSELATNDHSPHVGATRRCWSKSLSSSALPHTTHTRYPYSTLPYLTTLPTALAFSRPSNLFPPIKSSPGQRAHLPHPTNVTMSSSAPQQRDVHNHLLFECAWEVANKGE